MAAVVDGVAERKAGDGDGRAPRRASPPLISAADVSMQLGGGNYLKWHHRQEDNLFVLIVWL